MFQKIKRLDKKKKIALIFLFLGILVVSGMIVGLISFIISGGLFSGTKLTLGTVLTGGLLRWSGLRFSLILAVIIMLITIFLFTRNSKLNPVRDTDERGVSFLEKGTLGTSRWMSPKETAQVFEVNPDPGKHDRYILGYLRDGTKTTKDIVSTRMSDDGNRNVLVFGIPGSGKSFCLVRTEIAQAIKRGDSCIVTDPKMELYISMASYARMQGMKVWVINTADPEHSNCWNCLRECIDVETERIDSLRLRDFVTTFLINASTDPTARQEEFWLTGAINVMCAMVGILAWKREWYILSSFRELAQLLNQQKLIVYPNARLYETFENDNMFSLKEAEKIFREMARMALLTEKETDGIVKSVYKTAPEFSIAKVFRDIIYMSSKGVDEIVKELADAPAEHPAKIAFASFNGEKVKPETKAATIQGVALKLGLFQDRHLRAMLSNDEIDFRTFNRERTILFLITDDMSDVMKPISSLVFSFIIKDLAKQWDRMDMEAKAKGLQTNPDLVPVSFIMDEFYSIGNIPGFPKYMSTIRSRKLNMTIILQSLGQMIETYGENGANTIEACCDLVISLGTNDILTAQHISDFLAGKGSVRKEMHFEPEISLLPKKFSTEIGLSEINREVLTVDEVRRLKKSVLVAKRGELPLLLDRFGYIHHPCADHLEDSSIYDDIEPVSIKHGQDGFIIKRDKEPNLEELKAGIKEELEKYLEFFTLDFEEDDKKNPEAEKASPPKYGNGTDKTDDKKEAEEAGQPSDTKDSENGTDGSEDEKERKGTEDKEKKKKNDMNIVPEKPVEIIEGTFKDMTDTNGHCDGTGMGRSGGMEKEDRKKGNPKNKKKADSGKTKNEESPKLKWGTKF